MTVADVTVGAVDSFEVLFAEHQGPLLRFATLMVGDRSAAEDVVAEVFARLLHRGLPAEVGHVGAYLRRCVVNELRDGWRRQARRALLGGRVVTRSAAVTSETSPEFTSEVGERQRVLAAVVTLPARQRAVVVLRFYEDRSEAETAAILGLPVGTVKSTMSRARDTLHRLLEGDEP